jgi:BCD family chlorophyll transporter-like MFS transporter
VSTGDFGWTRIARLGLVQAMLGAVVVLTTSTLNRVMVVELALPALLPGVLVALHYAVQLTRPRMGYGSDVGGRCTPWILGGMAVLALGGVGAAAATVWMAHQRAAGTTLAVLSFVLIGLGVSACGTSLLVLLAKRVAEDRRSAAATVVWIMMIAGFAVTAGVAGSLLDPYSPARLLAVTAGVAAVAMLVACIAMAGLEGTDTGFRPSPRSLAERHAPFRVALAQVWDEPAARQFTVFVFISMLAYSAQDLIREPFAGSVHGFTPGESTQLSGIEHAGVLLGMIAAAVAGRRLAGRATGSLRAWTVGGCAASALAMFALASGGLGGMAVPFRPTVFALGVANGAFSIAAIASMMRLAGAGRSAREGVRMGLWGAAQACAFALGGLFGTAASDVARHLLGSPGLAYASVFALEGLLFVLSAHLAWRIGMTSSRSPAPQAARTEHFTGVMQR